MQPSEILFDKSINNSDKFGIYVRERRIELGITLRDFAKKLNLSPSYISDIENGNRTAPLSYLNKVASLLNIDKTELNYFYDIAGCSHSNWPDINDYLAKKPSARKAIRLAKDKNMSEKEFSEIILSLIKDKELEQTKNL